VWGSSNHYSKGKFTPDGRFNANAVDDRIGAGVLLKQMDEKGLLNNAKQSNMGE
jgi:lysozyme family protein